MPDIIRNNAYRILGLDGNANQRDIMKRYREITNRLKIDDHPQYALDLNLPDSFRTESSVDDALKKLQNRRSGLTEYFFWFDISGSVDEEVLSLLRDGDAASYGQAIQIWKEYFRVGNPIIGLSYKRNLAILYCLSMFNEENDAVLSESVLIWKAIVSSDKFWASFRKKYEMINDQKVHVGAMIDLKKNIAASISDIYYGLYAHHDNIKYVKEFHDVFGTFGPKTEKHLLKPIYQSVYGTIERLNAARDCGDDLDDAGRKFERIENAVEQLGLHMKQLRDLGLYDSDQVLLMRDHAAEAIGRASTMVCDEMRMYKKSVEMYNRAKNIATTASMKERLGRYAEIVVEIILANGEGAGTGGEGAGTGGEGAGTGENALLVIETGLIRKKYFVVKKTFIEYDATKIYYKNVDAVMWYGTGSDIAFKMTSNNDHVDIKISDKSVSDKLINCVWPLVVPHLMDRLMEQIFERKRTVRIGDVGFDGVGYHRSRAFRGDESVLWHSDGVYTPGIADNKVILYKSKNGKPKLFTTIPLEEPNAVIIPTLVKACHRKYRNRE